jgi:hypothetical protein
MFSISTKAAVARSTCLVVAVALLAAACGGGNDETNADAPTAQPTAVSTSQSASAQEPVGLIAIGHSGLNAQNSDPEMPRWGAPQNSWATGTVAEVNSVYERLIAVRPETEGHVFNAAEGGATSDALAEQAAFALRAVPAPALAIIMTIDNDIRCDGRDRERVQAFGENVAEALQVIVDASPRSRILIVSNLGRPAMLAESAAGDEFARRALSGTDACALFNLDGELMESNIATLTSIIEEYEAEQARVCASVPQCSTDDGVLATYPDSLDRTIPGDGHLNLAGQAYVADLIWPTVESLMRTE